MTQVELTGWTTFPSTDLGSTTTVLVYLPSRIVPMFYFGINDLFAM